MIEIIKLAGYALLFMCSFYTLFLAYSAVMNVGWAKMPVIARVLVAPYALLFLIMDVVFNYTLGSLMFLQLPTKATYTLSMRMSANIAATPATWRTKLSSVIVNTLLIKFTTNY